MTTYVYIDTTDKEATVLIKEQRAGYFRQEEIAIYKHSRKVCSIEGFTSIEIRETPQPPQILAAENFSAGSLGSMQSSQDTLATANATNPAKKHSS